MKNKLILPRTLDTQDPKYKHLNGKPKLSYSQVVSWTDPAYHYDYIKQYFMKIALPSGIFAEAGTDFGTMVEWIGNGRVGDKPVPTVLSLENVEEVANQVEYKPNSVYEDYVVVDCGDFVIEGYADKITYYEDEKEIDTLDYKTGNIDKPGKYQSQDYMQTRLYSYEKENLGYKIRSCGVKLYGRKGNGSEKSPLRLSGEVLDIATPYNREDVEKYLKYVATVAKDISDHYSVYLKYFS